MARAWLSRDIPSVWSCWKPHASPWGPPVLHRRRETREEKLIWWTPRDLGPPLTMMNLWKLIRCMHIYKINLEKWMSPQISRVNSLYNPRDPSTGQTDNRGAKRVPGVCSKAESTCLAAVGREKLALPIVALNSPVLCDFLEITIQTSF